MAIRVSASRLKTLKQCSLYFWYQEICRIPTPVHPRTAQGSCLHGIMEHILHPKRRLMLEAVLMGGFNLPEWPSLTRYIRVFNHHYPMGAYELSAMESMIRVALLGLKPYFTDDAGKFSPPHRILIEHKFKMQVGEAEMSGIFDLLLLWDDGRAVCLDYKSQGTKFTRAEVPHLIQAGIYQLACQREFGVIPPIVFIMLRHAPSTRTPLKHIQRVEPPSPTTLLGLSVYISAMHERLNQFGLAEAYANPNPDTGFCERVCQYLRPFTYYVVCAPDDPQGDNPISSHLSLDEATQSTYARENKAAIVLERRHEGCVARWRQ